jgi:hypothetical protein
MREKQVDADAGRIWGIGWSLRTLNGEQIVEHNGATNGFMARLMLIPDRQFAIAILTNSDHGGPVHGTIGAAAFERFFGLKESKPRPVFWSADRLLQFAGRYRHGLADLTLAVAESGYLVERRTTNPFSGQQLTREPFLLVPIGDNVLMAKGSDLDGAQADFILNTDGSVRFLRMGGRLGYPVRE